MDRQQPSGVLPVRPFVRFAKFSAAIGFLFLILFSGYQPQFTYPPVKQNIVKAQEQEQTKTIQAIATTLAFQSPHPGYLSTRFNTWHPGIDLATGLGMPVNPIAKGRVVSAGYNFFGLGLSVEIDHGEGFGSRYGHMGTIYVKEGQQVDNGSQLGVVGMTGNTTGPHTHLEIYKEGKAIDPATVLPPLRNQPQESDFIAVGGAYSKNQPKEQPVTPKAKVNTTPAPAVKIETPRPQLQLEIGPVKTSTAPTNSLQKVLTVK